MSKKSWIGVDLDGTLAEYHGWKGEDHIGPPIDKMLDRVVKWIESGVKVKILTARVAGAIGNADNARMHIAAWLDIFLGSAMAEQIEITHEKDQFMVELWDDRCVQVVPNTGERVDGIED